MRVDTVPLWLKPLFHTYGYGAAAIMQAHSRSLRYGCKWRWMQRAALRGPRIECIWHENFPAYAAAYLPPREAGVRYVWMNHPMWYMRPVHIVLQWNGVRELALGSSGHGGRGALQQVVAALSEGARTTMAVDGPAGPVHAVKRGALDMALQSGVPLVGIRFAYTRYVRTGEWDRKVLPLPFSEVRIFESEPLYVTAESFAQQRERLSTFLDPPA
ncbi:MAG: hypothetical protein RL385_4539 [Pseudomonadota bacterium]|jgi:lysophospholipid acyltransferase (LPLAT)-like uncharacterized protein